MRAVLQRVKNASVTIDGKIHSSIGTGLLVLIGIEEADTTDDVLWLSQKIVNMRVFSDAEGKMNLSVKDIGAEIMLVSQFTLFASTQKGNRPSFFRSAKPEIAIPVYQLAIKQIETDLGSKIQTGVFGTDMKISLLNDGPVTIIIDSKNKE
jgi:D-tyrosyl-tRNA(Tyr) deacylase